MRRLPIGQGPKWIARSSGATPSARLELDAETADRLTRLTFGARAPEGRSEETQRCDPGEHRSP